MIFQAAKLVVKMESAKGDWDLEGFWGLRGLKIEY